MYIKYELLQEKRPFLTDQSGSEKVDKKWSCVFFTDDLFLRKWYIFLIVDINILEHIYIDLQPLAT